MTDEPVPTAPQPERRCPFCAEVIQPAAIKCRHCGENLSARVPWYFSSGSMVMSFLLVGPFMLPLLWFRPGMDRNTKAAWTAVIVVISAFLAWSTYLSLKKILEYYEQMKGF